MMTVHQGAILLTLVAVLLVLTVSCLVLWVQLSRLKKRYRRLLAGGDQLSLEELLNQMNAAIAGVQEQNSNLGQRLGALESLASRFVGVGLVRYNAFQDTGSDLSFSLALLNHAGDGAIVTSIFGREENRLYGKPVRQGGSLYPLSPEEKAALEKAREAI